MVDVPWTNDVIVLSCVLVCALFWCVYVYIVRRSGRG